REDHDRDRGHDEDRDDGNCDYHIAPSLRRPWLHCVRTLTLLPRCAVRGSTASALSHCSLVTPSVAPLRPHSHIAPSLRRPWLHCVRTLTPFLQLEEDALVPREHEVEALAPEERANDDEDGPHHQEHRHHHDRELPVVRLVRR